jgi:uncharacterized protein (DUF1330 family)
LGLVVPPSKGFMLRPNRPFTSSLKLKITDAEGFKAVTQIPTGGADVAKELGGHYIARTNKITALDGGPAPERFIAYAFESAEKAQVFNN